MGVKPATKGPAISRGDPGQADLAQESLPDNPTTHDRVTHSADACQSDAPAGVASDYPTSAAGTGKCGLALAALQPVLSSTKTNPTAPPNPNKFLPRIPGEGHGPLPPPQSISVKERDGGPDTDLSFRLTFLSHKPGSRWTGPRGAAQHAEPTGPPMNVAMLRPA